MPRNPRAAAAVIIGLGLIGSSVANATPTYTPTFTSSLGSGTETFTASTGSQTTDFFAQFDIPKFDPTLGTLTGISVTLSGAMNAVGTVTNNGTTATGVGIAQNSTITNNPPQTISGSFGSQITNGTSNGDTFLKFTTSASSVASVGTVASGQTISNISLASAFASQTLTQTSGFDPNLIGTGTFSITLATGEFTNVGGTGGNLSAAAATADAVNLAVTYTFLTPSGGPASVPEPISLTLIGTGLMGIAAIVRRRRHD